MRCRGAVSDPQAGRHRVNTDRRDAASLARLHRAVWVPDAGHEAMRDLVRARLDAVRALRRARQQLSGFLLRQGCHYGRPAWTKLHRRWLAGLKFEQAVHHIVLEDYIAAVEAAQDRRDRLTAQIASVPSGLDCLNVTLEHDMMHCLLELEPREPSAMQLGPCRAPFERQLWSPNPTDFSLVAERREFRPFAEAGCDWQVRPEVPFVAREKIGRTQYNRRSARIRWRGLELRLFFRQSGLAQAGEICGFV